MFDMGFWELLLIGVLSLVVLGPERLPVAIRTVRDWISSAKKFSEGVKTELKEELRINELHDNLKKAEQSDLKNLSPEVAESLRSLKEAAEMVTRPYENSPTKSALANPLADSTKVQSQKKEEHKPSS